MGIPPNELERRIPQSQLTEWAGFEMVEGPILVHERLDYLGALLSFVTARVHGAKRARAEQFLPKWDRSVTRADSDVVQAMREMMEGTSQP